MSISVNLSDEELVDFVRKNDKESYIEVVRRYQEKLLRYVNYIIRDENQSDDIVQNTFIKAYKNLHGFNTKRKFSSWIYRIAHNEAVNIVRKKKNEISLEKNSWIGEKFAGKEDIIGDFEKKEAVKMIKLSLNRLPIKYRSPLTLFFLEEKSYEEISDILRIPKGTVGTRIGRGKGLLKKICRNQK